jgi:hypothetical protein
LSKARPAGSAGLNVCVQVNISGEATKGGVGPGRRGGARAGGRRDAGPQAARPDGNGEPYRRPGRASARSSRSRAFARGAARRGPRRRHLVDGNEPRFRGGDREGATMVRIGSAIFGERP